MIASKTVDIAAENGSPVLFVAIKKTPLFQDDVLHDGIFDVGIVPLDSSVYPLESFDALLIQASGGIVCLGQELIHG